MSGARTFPLAAAVCIFVFLSGCAAAGLCSYSSSEKSEAVKKYEQGKDLYDLRRYAEAQKYFQEVITDYPESAMSEVAIYYLAGSYKEQKDFPRAIATYQQLIDKYYSGFWVDLAEKEIAKIKAMQKK